MRPYTATPLLMLVAFATGCRRDASEPFSFVDHVAKITYYEHMEDGQFVDTNPPPQHITDPATLHSFEALLRRLLKDAEPTLMSEAAPELSIGATWGSGRKISFNLILDSSKIEVFHGDGVYRADISPDEAAELRALFVQ